MSNFKRKQFDFPIPKLVQQSIDDLENAVITNSLSLDCYLQEFRANVHCCTDGYQLVDFKAIAGAVLDTKPSKIPHIEDICSYEQNRHCHNKDYLGLE